MTDSLIQGRYRVVREIGRGAQGRTMLARDESTQTDVALKEFDFAGAGSWDGVGVFEREIAVLGGLEHPDIPRVLDSFRIAEDGELRMGLVQEFIDGEDLQRRLEAGELFDEARLRKIAKGVLDLLIYLHANSPPVLHRDVKPANLIERDNGAIALVDFGAAQGSQHGEAVIGTTGYMPAEQLMGRARPSSDLYALGATIIHLATRKHPIDLGEGLGLRWHEYANLSPKFTSWLDRMVAPMPEDRFPSALAAKRALKQRKKKGKKRALTEMRDKHDLASRDVTETPRGRYKIQRSFGRLKVKCKRSRLSPSFKKWIGMGLLIVGGILALFANFDAAAIFVFFGVVLGLLSRATPRIIELEAHDLGLDLVWAGEEVVQRIMVEDIAAPDLEPIVAGKALVLWTRDGRRFVLDHQMGSARDARVMRAIIQAWLAEARRLQ